MVNGVSLMYLDYSNYDGFKGSAEANFGLEMISAAFGAQPIAHSTYINSYGLRYGFSSYGWEAPADNNADVTSTTWYSYGGRVNAGYAYAPYGGCPSAATYYSIAQNWANYGSLAMGSNPGPVAPACN